MRTGLVISMVLHAALIALALYPWPRPKLEISPEAPPILVETFEIAEETNIAAAAPEPAPPPPPEPPAEGPVAPAFRPA
ncbi:MAG TPA: hypothetical protein DCL48_14980, partial [Alphaproteobacteria bacterium]|nr:hypothetical protein [Alphaproteobacteria bacterium]